MIDDGIDVNHQDDDGWSALHFLVQKGTKEVVTLLLSSGSDANLIDSHGNSPLWVATINTGCDLEILRLLLQAGAISDRKNKYGRSPLDMAMKIQNGLEKEFNQHSENKI